MSILSYVVGLFKSLTAGYNLQSAFTYALNSLNKYSYSMPQPTPQLYSCGDNFAASDIYLPAVQIWGLNPYIDSIEINHVIQDEISIPIKVKVIQGAKPIQRVWSQIINPDIVMQSVDESIKLEEIDYKPEQGIYVSSLKNLYQNGIYTILTYAMDGDSNISEPYVTYINVTNNILCDLNDDTKIDLQDLIIALQIMCQIETDMTFNPMDMESQIDLKNVLWLMKKVGE